MSRRPLIALALAAVLALGRPGFATDPPDSVVNPVDDVIETVDAKWTGTDYDIRLVRNPGDGNEVEIQVVAEGAGVDVDPKLAVRPAGDVVVAWWRDAAVDEVRVRFRSGPTGPWGTTRTVSESGVSSTRPDLAVHDGRVWAAWEYDGAGATGVAVREIVEDPDPLPPLGFASVTGRGGEIDVRLRSESGSLWMTWLEDADVLGWTELDPVAGTWSPADTEPLEPGGADAARERVRQRVLAP